MATKKQKHAAALEKHEKFMAEQKRTGLEAQSAAKSQEKLRLERKRKKTENEAQENADRHKGILALNKIKETE